MTILGNATFTSDKGRATPARRKYAGRWVPVVIFNGKRVSFPHCDTEEQAADAAMREAQRLVS